MYYVAFFFILQDFILQNYITNYSLIKYRLINNKILNIKKKKKKKNTYYAYYLQTSIIHWPQQLVQSSWRSLTFTPARRSMMATGWA